MSKRGREENGEETNPTFAQEKPGEGNAKERKGERTYKSSLRPKKNFRVSVT